MLDVEPEEGDDRKVGEKDQRLEHRHVFDEYVDLHRNEEQRTADRQPLGPGMIEPQPDRLDKVQCGVREGARGDQAQGIAVLTILKFSWKRGGGVI